MKINLKNILIFILISSSFMLFSACNDTFLQQKRDNKSKDNSSGEINGGNEDNSSDNTTGDNGSGGGGTPTDNKTPVYLPDLTTDTVDYANHKDNFTTTLINSPTYKYRINTTSSGLSAKITVYDSKTNQKPTGVKSCIVDFGDGAIKSFPLSSGTILVESIAHFYARSGIYLVTVKIETPDGNVHTVTSNVKVQQLPLSENFRKPFDSSLYYGRSLLTTQAEKNAYDIVVKEMLQFDYSKVIYRDYKGELNNDPSKNKSGYIRISLRDKNADVTESQLSKILLYIKDDEPRSFIINAVATRGAVIYNTNKVDNFLLSITALYTDEQASILGSAIKDITELNPKQSFHDDASNVEVNAMKILSKIKPTMTDVEKFKIIHDGLILFVKYGSLFSRGDSSILGAFTVDRRGAYSVICGGYAVALQYLCQLVGIKSVFIVGTVGKATESTTAGGAHAWNYVNIGGVWYATDPTWDDSSFDHSAVLHNYYLRGTTNFDREHTAYKLPNGSDTGYRIKPTPLANSDHQSAPAFSLNP